MSASFDDIYTIFHSKPQMTSILPDGLEQQWLINSFSEYYLAFSVEVEYDIATETITTDLDNYDKQLLAKMIYRQYLERERDKVSKVANFVGKDIKFTGYGDKQKTFQKLVDNVQSDIDYDISRMLVL